jgi:segregation and condensation protein B
MTKKRERSPKEDGGDDHTDASLPAAEVEPHEEFERSEDTVSTAPPFDPASDPGLGDGGAAPEPPQEEPPPIVEAADRLPSIVESLLLAADKPLSPADLGQLVGERDLGKIEHALAALEEHYRGRGIQLGPVAGGWQLRTNPENAPWVQKLIAQKPVRLTRSQLETMAIIGYRQPITRPEIDEIRGVDSGGTLKTLLDRGLVRILGKKEEPGRPLLYGTTRDFLEFFNLRDLKDLPTLREFHELSEEHQAQVAALESVAPEGSVDGPDAPPSDVPPPLARVELSAGPADDTAELDEIDRLIATADSGPAPPKPDDAAKPESKPEE